MNTKFSVLMSLYKKEKTEYADECFKSLLRQTVQANEWIIVEDGPLTQEMYDLLNSYQKEFPDLIKRVPLKENQGLGIALQIGVEACSYDLIARMDTDDIAREDRFEKQLAEFENNPELDLCGAQIDEFEDSPENVVAQRIVPTKQEDIYQYQKTRDAFNHMTVMFKKNAVLNAGNYQSCPLMEDTFLWVRMLQQGSICKNVDETLLYARIGKDMYERRGGWKYFLRYRSGRKKVYKTGFISYFDYLYTIIIQFIIALLPSRLRGLIYKKKLHKTT